MKKKLLLVIWIIISMTGYCQIDKSKRICFYFMDQYNSIVKPDRVEIIDNQGGFFRLSEDYCFDCPTMANYAFSLKIQDVHYYNYEKIYEASEILMNDTIKLDKIEKVTSFSINSEKPVLTDNEIEFLIDKNHKIVFLFHKEELKIQTLSFKDTCYYDYGFFTPDTEIINQKRFIVETNKKSIFSEIANIGDSIFFISIPDWNDNYFCFGFKKSNNKIFPIKISNNKINEIFITAFPYIYINIDCGIIMNVKRVIDEYIYHNKSHYYYDIYIYNLPDHENLLNNNVMRIDVSSIKTDFIEDNFIDKLYSKKFFSNILKVLKICN